MLHHRLAICPADAQCRVERGEWVRNTAPSVVRGCPPPHRREVGEVLTLEQYGAGDLRGRAQEVQDAPATLLLPEPDSPTMRAIRRA